MKIFHIIPGLSESSGPTQALAHLSAHQARAGKQVTVCYVGGRGTDPQREFPPEVAVKGFAAKWLCRWAYSPSLRAYLNENVGDADLLHIHSMWLYPNIVASQAARLAGVPYVIRPAGSLEPWCLQRGRTKKRLYLSLIERRILNRSAAIHAVSQQEAENISLHGFTAPTFVLPNGVDFDSNTTPASKSEHRRRLGLPTNRPLVLFLSRIHQKKGLDILGSAMIQVREKIPNAMLVVAGPDGHEYALEVKKLYGRLGLADHTMFLGELTGIRKQCAYRAADVFVLPTRSENFGVVVLEAMAEGLPVVVSKNAPWSILEEEGAGCWVDNEPATIANSIVNVLINPSLRESMSQRARELVKRRFSWSTIEDTLERIYRNIIAGRDPNAGLLSDASESLDSKTIET